jgi:hypothetical protein
MATGLAAPSSAPEGHEQVDRSSPVAATGSNTGIIEFRGEQAATLA